MPQNLMTQIHSRVQRTGIANGPHYTWRRRCRRKSLTTILCRFITQIASGNHTYDNLIAIVRINVAMCVYSITCLFLGWLSGAQKDVGCWYETTTQFFAVLKFFKLANHFLDEFEKQSQYIIPRQKELPDRVWGTFSKVSMEDGAPCKLEANATATNIENIWWIEFLWKAEGATNLQQEETRLSKEVGWKDTGCFRKFLHAGVTRATLLSCVGWMATLEVDASTASRKDLSRDLKSSGLVCKLERWEWDREAGLDEEWQQRNDENVKDDMESKSLEHHYRVASEKEKKDGYERADLSLICHTQTQ